MKHGSVSPDVRCEPETPRKEKHVTGAIVLPVCGSKKIFADIVDLERLRDNPGTAAAGLIEYSRVCGR